MIPLNPLRTRESRRIRKGIAGGPVFGERGVPRLRPLRVLLVLSLLFGQAWGPIVEKARAQDEQALLENGIELYADAEFEKAAEELRAVIPYLHDENLARAHQFLARCLVRMGRREEGIAAFHDMLRIAPDWRPDPIFVPPDEISAFEEALGAVPSEKPASGSLRVNTDPSGATAVLDKRTHPDRTPLTFEEIAGGDHSLRVELSGYVPVDTTVAVEAGRETSVRFQLEGSGGIAPSAGTPWWKQKKVLAGGGVLLVAVTALALSGGGDGGGGDEGGDLAGPPNPPY